MRTSTFPFGKWEPNALTYTPLYYTLGVTSNILFHEIGFSSHVPIKYECGLCPLSVTDNESFQGYEQVTRHLHTYKGGLLKCTMAAKPSLEI